MKTYRWISSLNCKIMLILTVNQNCRLHTTTKYNLGQMSGNSSQATDESGQHKAANAMLHF